MKQHQGLNRLIFVTTLLCMTEFGATAQIKEQPILNTLGKVSVFLQTGVSVPNMESSPSFTPDGKTVYLTENKTLKFSKLHNDRWSRPVNVSFSGTWEDYDPFLTPDGKHLIFVSNRPFPEMSASESRKYDQLWIVDHLSGDEWSKPKHLEMPINSEDCETLAPSVSQLGTLYFCSRNRDGNKGMNSYYAKWIDGGFEKPKLIVINGFDHISDPFIAPDERYLLYASKGNLYVSCRQENGWSTGQKLAV